MLRGDTIIRDMARGAEAYLQTWERAWGIPGDACRSDVRDLSADEVASVARGTHWSAVLETLGQANTRLGSTFTFCVEGDRSGTVTFDGDGRVSAVQVS